MSLPSAFSVRMQSILKHEYPDFVQSHEKSAPVSIRINPLKTNTIPSQPKVAWCEMGIYLEQRPVFTLDPLFHAGTYYVQEASSMFLEQAVRQCTDTTRPIKALDLCAAPGGKSTHLASLLSEESLLISNEVIRSRAQILSENIQKWGSGNIVVTNNDPRDFKKLSDFFDLIVVDAPCSGEGMFRKDINAREEWSEDNVKLCAQRQQRILTNIWDSLKPGGILIYSTCTYNTEENEENLRWLIKNTNAKNLELNINPRWGITPSQYEGIKGYHFYPHKTDGEGFFISIVQKCGTPKNTNTKKHKKHKFQKPQSLITEELTSWIKKPKNWEFIIEDDIISILPKNHLIDLEEVYQSLNVIYGGCAIAQIKKKNLKPLHPAALFTGLNINQHICYNTTHKQALQYLKRENIEISSLPQGHILVCYKGVPLGWAKNIKQRINNNFPKEWRIRMQIPDNIPGSFWEKCP